MASAASDRNRKGGGTDLSGCSMNQIVGGCGGWRSYESDRERARNRPAIGCTSVNGFVCCTPYRWWVSGTLPFGLVASPSPATTYDLVHGTPAQVGRVQP